MSTARVLEARAENQLKKLGGYLVVLRSRARARVTVERDEWNGDVWRMRSEDRYTSDTCSLACFVSSAIARVGWERLFTNAILRASFFSSLLPCSVRNFSKELRSRDRME